MEIQFTEDPEHEELLKLKELEELQEFQKNQAKILAEEKRKEAERQRELERQKQEELQRKRSDALRTGGMGVTDSPEVQTAAQLLLGS